jgi:hypothetical protein
MKRIANSDEIKTAIEAEFDRTGGIFRLAPCWVGRPGIIVPGRRIKLLQEYISQEVAVNERWLASVTYADNGVYNKVCPADHGLSYLVIGEAKIQLKDALAICGELLLGPNKRWDVLPKFFDNWGRIPHHLHPCDDHVRKGLIGKPESYHFPLELNVNRNAYPRTPIGVDAGVSDARFLKGLSQYFKGDNHLTDFANTINLVPGTGWYMPPCTLHGPGSLATYELQVASDVTCIPESRLDDTVMPPDLLDRDLPVTVARDGEEAVFAHIVKMINCPKSGNRENFRQQYYRPPVVVRQENGCHQDYVIYRCGRASEKENPDLYSAKHTVVAGKRSWELAEHGAFGVIVLAGHGTVEVPGKAPVEIESTSLFYDREELGADEVFVSAPAAARLHVRSASVERLSLYQHFASGTNPDAQSLSPES